MTSRSIVALPLNEQVYQTLLSRIISGFLAQGERLDAAELARELGVSRTPVKDALAHLAAQGLVEIHPRRRTFVSIVTRRDIEELYELRKMIELYAAEPAGRNLRQKSLAWLRAKVEELKGFITDDGYTDYASFLAEDHRFHSYIVELAGNQRLLQIYNGIRLHLQLARMSARRALSGAQETYAEHLEILSALEARSADALKQALSRHIDNRLAQFRRDQESEARQQRNAAATGRQSVPVARSQDARRR